MKYLKDYRDWVRFVTKLYIKIGFLVKMPYCERCGREDCLIIHHLKYEMPPTQSSIQTLCIKCHKEIHRNTKIKI